jgi:hypothetical protein
MKGWALNQLWFSPPWMGLGGLKRFKKNVPWVLLWKGALAISVGIAIAMAIAINVYDSYHPNYVLSLKLYYDRTMQVSHMVLH